MSDEHTLWTPPRPPWFRFVVVILLVLIALGILASVAGLLFNF